MDRKNKKRNLYNLKQYRNYIDKYIIHLPKYNGTFSTNQLQ